MCLETDGGRGSRAKSLLLTLVPAHSPQQESDNTVMKASTCTGWQTLVGTTGGWEQGEWKGRCIAVTLPSLPVNESAHAESSGQSLREGYLYPSPSAQPRLQPQSCWRCSWVKDSRIAPRARSSGEGKRGMGGRKHVRKLRPTRGLIGGL